MISKDISKSVLHIGTDINEKGGIATLLKSYSVLFEQFNFICSHKFTNKFSQILLLFTAIIKMIYWCLFKNIKIVHIHAAAYNSFTRKTIFVFLAKLFRKKVVLHMHAGEFEPSYLKNKKLYNYSCNKADVIVAVSNGLKATLLKYFNSKAIITIYNIVDKPLFVRPELDYNKEILNVLFMGAINDNKGIFEVIAMWGKNKSELINRYKLTICGVGDDAKLIDLISKYDLQDNVEYLGWVGTEKKNRLLVNTDIYIQPSYFESLGIAIIEAMSYGIPVVATNTGGIPEIVSNKDNGYLINVGQMLELKNSLDLIYDNRDSILVMKNNALKKANEFFVENIENDIISLYRSLI